MGMRSGFPDRRLKSLIGHPQGACGAAGVAATLLAMRDGVAPPRLTSTTRTRSAISTTFPTKPDESTASMRWRIVSLSEAKIPRLYCENSEVCRGPGNLAGAGFRLRLSNGASGPARGRGPDRAWDGVSVHPDRAVHRGVIRSRSNRCMRRISRTSDWSTCPSCNVRKFGRTLLHRYCRQMA